QGQRPPSPPRSALAGARLRRGENLRVMRFGPLAFVGVEPPQPLQFVLIGPDRQPPTCHGNFARVYPADALPLVQGRHRDVQLSGYRCQSVFLGAESHLPRGSPMWALAVVLRQQARDHLRRKPRRPLGGSKALPVQTLSNLRHTLAGLAQAGAPLEEGWRRGKLGITGTRGAQR